MRKNKSDYTDKDLEHVKWINGYVKRHLGQGPNKDPLSWVLELKEVALMLGEALWWFWSVRGYHSEGRRWLEEVLAMDGRASPEVRAMTLAGVGSLALEQGDLDRAQEACEEGLELLAHEEAIEAKLWLLKRLGWVAWQREEHDQATQLYEESLALSREMSDTWWIASSLSNLAPVSRSLGDSERATELYEDRQVYADPSPGGTPPLRARFGKTVEKLRGTR